MEWTKEEDALRYKLRQKVRIAFEAKLVDIYDYIDDMVANDEKGAMATIEIAGQKVQTIGLDAEHNVNEILKDLENI
jgi:hypothetical protein